VKSDTCTTSGTSVHDMQQARDLYRRQHGMRTFARNFVEILMVATARSRIPADARPVPLQVPPAALPGVVARHRTHGGFDVAGVGHGAVELR